MPSLLFSSILRLDEVKTTGASLGTTALLVFDVLRLDADELHGNHERGDEIYMAALLVSGDLPPRVR